jgi:hypothetical protein
MEALVLAYPSRLIHSGTYRRLSLSFASTLFSGLALAILSSSLGVTSAQAASAAKCPSATLSQPFTRWGDENFYALVAGSQFEQSPSEWTLSGGAERLAGGEPYPVAGSPGAWSLALPAGASAQSPFVCVEPNDRTFRFFARGEARPTTLLVQAVYETSRGNVVSTSTKLVMTRSWAPSPILHTGAARAAATNGETALALRFTGVSGTSRIDGVYIDPRMR